MIITYFRSSSFNQFNLCQQSYFMNYVLGIPQPSGKRAEIGTIVHKVFECLAKMKQAHQNGVYFIVDEHFGVVNCPDLFDPMLVSQLVDLSYSYYTDSVRSINKFAPRDKVECHNLVVSVLNEGLFDPRLRNILEAEPFFDFEIKEDWAKYDYGNGVSGYLSMKGTIDLVTMVGDTMCEVIDWKTGQRKDWSNDQVKDFWKLSKDPQLRIYHLALSQMYPDIKHFAITIHWVRDGGPFTLSFGPEDLVDTHNMLRKQFKRIQETTRPKLKSTTGSHWFCKRVCNYGKSQHQSGCTLCQFIKKETIKKGMDYVIDQHTADDFTVDYYHNPGS